MGELNSGMGESYYASPGLYFSAEAAVGSWYSEISDYNYAPVDSDGETKTSGAVVGHYTQVKWQTNNTIYNTNKQVIYILYFSNFLLFLFLFIIII